MPNTAIAPPPDLRQLARTLTRNGCAHVAHLTDGEILTLAEHADVPADQLHLKGGVLRHERSERPNKACARKREEIIEAGSIGCDFCGHSIRSHRSKRDPVQIQSGGAS